MQVIVSQVTVMLLEVVMVVITLRGGAEGARGMTLVLTTYNFNS